MIDLTPAQKRIEPIQHLLVDAYEVAVNKKWKRFVKRYPHYAHPLDATARANFIHCHLAYEIGQRFEDVPAIEPTDALDFYALRWVDGTLLMRFKYLNHGLPSNVDTGQQVELGRQEFTPEMMLALAGDSSMNPPTFLTCGYTLEGLELATIEIRCDCEHHQTWSFQIYGGEALVEPLIMSGLRDKTRPALVASKKKRPTPLRVVTTEEE